MPDFPYLFGIEDINSNDIQNYLSLVKKGQIIFEESIVPTFESLFVTFGKYQKTLYDKEKDVNYSNPMIYTQKIEYILYILLIQYTNQLMRNSFDQTSKKVIVLPRCLTGPNFDYFKVKKTKIGWHRIIKCNHSNCDAWKLTLLGKEYGFEVFITMGRRFKEPNFLHVFKNLRKEFGNFGLVPVACIPELALGRTYVIEMGIPSHAVPLYFSGCSKWHGSEAICTDFPFQYILELLNLNK